MFNEYEDTVSWQGVNGNKSFYFVTSKCIIIFNKHGCGGFAHKDPSSKLLIYLSITGATYCDWKDCQRERNRFPLQGYIF